MSRIATEALPEEGKSEESEAVTGQASATADRLPSTGGASRHRHSRQRKFEIHIDYSPEGE
jgi:hypothetical protein